MNSILDGDDREYVAEAELKPLGEESNFGLAGAPTTFAGDRGELPLDTRRVLVQLLQGPVVDGTRQTKQWPVLLRDEQILRARLHEMFLEMVVDYDQKIAFLRQVVAEDIDAPILLRRKNLTFLETVLLLYLRQRLTHAETQGERAVVSLPEMVEYLKVYERDRNVDHVRFERQMGAAVDKVKMLNLIRKLRGSDERFEVIPTLKLLFPAEEILALTQIYKDIRQAAMDGAVAGPDGDVDVIDSLADNSASIDEDAG